jgi:hypothetical protein
LTVAIDAAPPRGQAPRCRPLRARVASVLIVRLGWSKLPPVMERSLRDDLKWALAVLVGATLGYFVFAGDDVSLLLGSFLGVTVVLVALAVARRIGHRRDE